MSEKKVKSVVPIQKESTSKQSKVVKVYSIDNPKSMKVPRGTARMQRRLGLVRNWRNTKGAKQMAPVASETIEQ